MEESRTHDIIATGASIITAIRCRDFKRADELFFILSEEWARDGKPLTLTDTITLFGAEYFALANGTKTRCKLWQKLFSRKKHD